MPHLLKKHESSPNATNECVCVYGIKIDHAVHFGCKCVYINCSL